MNKKVLIGGLVAGVLAIGAVGNSGSSSNTAAVSVSPNPSIAAISQEASPQSVTAPSIMPSPLPSPSPSPSPKPSVKPSPTPKPVVSTPTPTPAPKVTGGSWGCDCSKTCDEMASCAEAQYQLNSCGCSRRDADHDGIACDSQCQ